MAMTRCIYFKIWCQILKTIFVNLGICKHIEGQKNLKHVFMALLGGLQGNYSPSCTLRNLHYTMLNIKSSVIKNVIKCIILPSLSLKISKYISIKLFRPLWGPFKTPEKGRVSLPFTTGFNTNLTISNRSQIFFF